MMVPAIEINGYFYWIIRITGSGELLSLVTLPLAFGAHNGLFKGISTFGVIFMLPTLHARGIFLC